MSTALTHAASGPRRRTLRTRLHDRHIGRLLDRLRHGTLTLVMPEGAVIERTGPLPGPQATLVMHRERTLARLALRGDLGLAEAYMDGDWSTPDLAALLLLGALNQEAMGGGLGGTLPFRLLARLFHLARANTRSGSRRNIQAHYDLGNAFYAQWLDAGMSYSAALFEQGPGESLEAAQTAKQDRILAMLDTGPGQRVLEIGCGWGGLLERLAQDGAQATGLTLSPSQHAYTTARLAKAGLDGLAASRLQDYRDVDGAFDRIVSIEMFEAVGQEYWPLFFDTVRDRLAPDGVAVLQIITIDESRFEAYASTPDFIQAHVFPGGMLPTRTHLAERIAAAGLALVEQVGFGLGYAKTLQDWRDRFERAWPELRAMGFDESFRRRWRYYLCYCEAGFRTGMLDVGLFRLTHQAAAAP